MPIYHFLNVDALLVNYEFKLNNIDEDGAYGRMDLLNGTSPL
jgi:hypothetical protein